MVNGTNGVRPSTAARCQIWQANAGPLESRIIYAQAKPELRWVDSVFGGGLGVDGEGFQPGRKCLGRSHYSAAARGQLYDFSPWPARSEWVGSSSPPWAELHAFLMTEFNQQLQVQIGWPKRKETISNGFRCN